MLVVLASITAATAAALAWPSPPVLADRAVSVSIRIGATAAAAALLVFSTPQAAALAVVALGVVVACRVLLGRRRSARAAREVAGRVLETCELLAAEVASGQPPGRCLRRAAEGWPALGPVAEAGELGGDVPAALRRLSGIPGAADLRLLAAAWAVSSRSGEGLAESVRRCADGLRAATRARRIVEGELASARATARLVAALPALALLMGSGAGGSPLPFLLGDPMGLACLAGGLLFGFAGLWWIEVIAADVESGS